MYALYSVEKVVLSLKPRKHFNCDQSGVLLYPQKSGKSRCINKNNKERNQKLVSD